MTVLTNALEATDVPAVHAGYAMWRRPLLEAGVELFELKRSTAQPGGAKPVRGGSSSSSLHAKTFIVDRTHLFVGSFNFDPRSASLNTELGFVIDSAVLAGAMADGLARRLPGDGLSRAAARWPDPVGGQLGDDGIRIYDTEPRASLGLRLLVWVLSLLPIGELL